MRQRTGLRDLFVAAVAVILATSGCPRRTLDLAGRPCKEGDCIDQYACHPELDLCAPNVTVERHTVRPGESCPAEHIFIDCREGGSNCSLGCFTCQKDLTWSPCSKSCVGDECDCEPSSQLCDNLGNLILCDEFGFIESTVDCGTLGCNGNETLNYCNECVADSSRCDGTVLTGCGSDGRVAVREECSTDSRCTNAGFCNPATLQCDVRAQAADDTPCDEGAGGNGDYCDSACVSGVCTAQRVARCDDVRECTGPDNCDPTQGCLFPDLPPGEPCADRCAWSCDGIGHCVETAVDCADDNPCTDDNCDVGTGCTHPFNAIPCDDGNACTKDELCSGGTCGGGLSGGCDDSNPCTVDSCIATNQCGYAPVTCVGTTGDCHGDNSCSLSGADSNCDMAGTAINEGLGCSDCSAGAGLCLTCLAGICQNQQPCDGSPAALPCVDDTPCLATGSGCAGSECAAVGCDGASFEHQACADFESGTTWGVGKPCQAVSCTSDDGSNHSEAIGADCTSRSWSSPETTSIQYDFKTFSPSGTRFNLWMRNLVDTGWPATDFYDCTLTGVTGIGGTFAFSFLETDLDNAGRHGTGCGDYGNSSKYCWMAADFDSSPTTYNPVPLDSGLHRLDCSFVATGTPSGAEDAGFDGLIFTADLSFVPDERANTICDDSDQNFSEGDCVDSNWGPNRSRAVGRCSDANSINQGANCSDCSSSGNCSVCTNGLCREIGLCDDTESCHSDLECSSLGGTCGVIGDCTPPVCSGGAREHFACADTEVGASWGPPNPCSSTICIEPGGQSAGTAIGQDCYMDGNQTLMIEYRFSTQYWAPFNIWMRNAVDNDLDPGEHYACSITGALPVDPFAFTFKEIDLDNKTRHGTGCGNYGNRPYYCWMALDSDADVNNEYNPIILDAGEHLLSCTIRTSRSGESAGFDGIIVTSDLGFVPDEQDGPTACADDDQSFTDGACTSVNNWGPNVTPTPGLCNIGTQLPDGDLCSVMSVDICCGNSCVARDPSTGSCP